MAVAIGRRAPGGRKPDSTRKGQNKDVRPEEQTDDVVCVQLSDILEDIGVDHTVHYRLRRSCELTGIDLQDSGQRLLMLLQIRLWTRSGKH